MYFMNYVECATISNASILTRFENLSRCIKDVSSVGASPEKWRGKDINHKTRETTESYNSVYTVHVMSS